MESIHDGNLAGTDVGNHLGDEEGTELGTQCGTGLCPVAHLFLKGVHAANAYAIHHTDAVLVGSLQVDAAVLDALDGTSQRILAVEVHLAGFLAVDAEVGWLEILYLAGKLCLELRGIEMCNRAGTAHAVHQILPGFLDRISQWGDGTKTCYNNSFQFHIKECVLLLVGLDVGDGIGNSGNLLCLVIGDGHFECLLKFHNQLYGVQRICTQVVGERCFGSYVCFINTQLVYDNLFYFCFNFRHCSNDFNDG